VLVNSLAREYGVTLFTARADDGDLRAEVFEPERMETIMSESALRQIASELQKRMACNCDLDKWEPEKSTGHSWVCRIHKAAKKEMQARAQPNGD